MKNNSCKNVLQDKKILYVGTSENIAKLAPTKGLEPPIFLTDVYPGFFCKQNCQKGERWGIISINLEKLNLEMMAPSPAYITKGKDATKILEKITNHKTKWQKSLTNCGVCLYISKILPNAIEKVMIYTPSGDNANKTINSLVDELPEPYSTSLSEHKAAYPKSLGLLRWFNGEYVKCEDIFNGKTNVKLINEMDDKLSNRFGLDVYYIKPEEKNRKKQLC